MNSLFPASFAQRRLWFIQEMSPQNTAYNMRFLAELPFRADSEVMQHALNDLTAHHETLRTSFAFENEEVIQIVAPHAVIPLQVHDLCGAATAADREFMQHLSRCASQVFDLSKLSLMRAHLAILPENRSSLGIVLHHIIADGHSARILLEDLAVFYEARIAGRPPLLPELPVQYADYAVWQRQSLSGKRLEKLTDYWRRRLTGVSDLALVHDRPRPPRGSTSGCVHSFTIPVHVVRRLQALAADSSATLFSALLTVFLVTLGRFTGQSSIAVGIPVSGRPRRELKRVAGLFINSLVFRADLSANPTFEKFLSLTNLAWAEDLTHQELPFELLVDALHTTRSADRNPIFQAMFQLQTADGSSAVSGNGQGRFEAETATSQLDLSVIQYVHPAGHIDAGMVYASDIFDGGTVRQLVDAYLAVLEDAALHPATRIASLPISGAKGRPGASAVCEGERRDWPGPSTLQESLAEQAARSPDNVAIISDEACLTFGELDARANALAAVLRRMGVRPGRVVAICLPRSTQTFVAILGVLKAGAAYLCLDPRAPAEWRGFIVSDCDAALVIGPPDRPDLAFGRPLMSVDRMPLSDAPEPGTEKASPNDPAYMIFTSGSTGRPKGVVIPHRSIVNHMRWMLECFPMSAGDRVLQRTPLTFDASVWEVLAPLLSGATLVLAPEEQLFDPAALLERIMQLQITTLQVVPSLLRVLVRHRGMKHCTTLKRVFCGGEVLTADVRDEFFRMSSAELINLYGPTETTIDATFHLCRRDDTRPFVPIGRPIANATATVLDAQQMPVPAGAVGELHIGGAAVGAGYLNRPQLTAERFLDDPRTPGGKLYRTGDRVRLLASGELQFLGRIDEQVKIRGFRVELGEIEAILVLHPSVHETAAVVQDLGTGDQRLVAFVSPRRAETPSLLEELKAWLHGRLPEHCVPSAIAFLSSLPKTAHGKVDRVALATMPVTSGSVAEAVAEPRNPHEREICRCFQELLRSNRVGIDENFFQLGGHSLLVISLQERLFQAFGLDVRVVDVFEHPTPRQLARRLAQLEKPLRQADLAHELAYMGDPPTAERSGAER